MSTIRDFMSVETQNELALRGGEIHLLVVEPDLSIRADISAALTDKFTVLFALNGKQAMDILHKHRPQTVISEINLPVLNGQSLLSAMREDPGLAKIPFVVLTSEASENVRIEFLENGANDYLLKPFLSQELVARVHNLIRLRKYQHSLEQGLEAARIIQHALMPPSQMNFINASFEFLYYPCDELSGDFLDVIQTGSSFYIYLADVMSHGTAAAQVTYLIKGLFREAVNHAEGPGTLSDILRRVGRGYSTLGLDYNVGIRAIQYKSDTKEIIIAGSNAPDPLIVSGQHLFDVTHRPGPLLDAELWIDEPFPMGVVSLKSGDFVYLFTDGCMEFPMIDGRQMGFMKFLAILRDADPRTWRTSVMNQFIVAHGSPKFPDDITIGRLQIQ